MSITTLKEFWKLFSILKRLAGVKPILRSLKTPVVYYDIGSAGYLDIDINFLFRDGLLECIGIDPGDEEWLKVLIPRREVLQTIFKLPRVKHLPYAVGASNKEVTFYRTAHPGCSSTKEPDLSVTDNLTHSEIYQTLTRKTVNMARLDTLIEGKLLPPPRIVKLDIQGGEYDALIGLGSFLNTSCIALEFECRFRPIYKDERVFSEYYDFLQSKGYRLRAIRSEDLSSKEALEIYTLWSREPTCDIEVDILRIWEILKNLDEREAVFKNFIRREGHLIKRNFS